MYSIARPYCSQSHNLKSILLFKVKIMVDNMDNIFVHSYKIINTKNYRLSFNSWTSDSQEIVIFWPKKLFCSNNSPLLSNYCVHKYTSEMAV